MMIEPVSVVATGCVTPLGMGRRELRRAVLEGVSPVESRMSLPWRGEEAVYYSLPPEVERELARLPRLRRASGISYAAVAAARGCLDAVPEGGELPTKRAVVFSASDGSVQFTRRFFESVEENGPGGGSPLLFPETVFNAPASHLCATLGWTGEALSLVGDACSGLQAGAVASDLLRTGASEMVLVVAAQEADGISMEAYEAWGIGAKGGTGGTIFSEGAGGILLQAEGAGPAVRFHPGMLRTRGNTTRGLLQAMAEDLCVTDDSELLVVLSGTDASAAEYRAAQKLFPSATLLQPRRVLGEALCAASLWQVVLAVELLGEPPEGKRFRCAFVPVFGYQGQAGAALVEARP